MIELRKKGVLKVAVGSLFVCSFISALIYPMIFASHNDKVHFLMSPNPHAIFSPPLGKEADIMFVWVAVVKDSTYGSFNVALVAYETYNVENTHHHLEYHWYTENLRAGETMAYPIESTWGGIPLEWDYDVSIAKIDITTSEHYLKAEVTTQGKTLFTAEFWADTSVSTISRVSTLENVPQELCLSVEAYRPTLQASVTGLEVGDFTGGHFDYIDTELIDSSLLP